MPVRGLTGLHLASMGVDHQAMTYTLLVLILVIIVVWLLLR